MLVNYLKRDVVDDDYNNPASPLFSSRTPDEVVIVESPKVTFLFDGVKAQVQVNEEAKKSCGICGHHAHTQAEAMEGPNK